MRALTYAIAMTLFTINGAAQAAKIERTKQANDKGARVVSVDNLIFPAGFAGTEGDGLAQVDQVVEAAHKLLAERGLGIGAMAQHTVFVKDGAVAPGAVIQRFHGTATRLAPSLKDHPSVGTIVRVPEFPDPRTLVMIDLVAGAPAKKGGSTDDFKRVPFKFGPKEIVETIRIDPLVFTSGMEAMDFEHRKLAETLDGQIDAVVDKFNVAATNAGMSLGNMVTHTIYVTKGTDPMELIQKFHPSIRRHTQDLAKYPVVGGIVIVDGMMSPAFKLETEAVFAPGNPADLKRVPLSEVSLDVSRSVAVGDLVYLSSMPGVDFENKLATPADVMQQVEIAVKNVHNSLKKSGLGFGDVVKHRLYLKKGAGDPAAVRAKFYEVAARYAPGFAKNPSAETFVIVEGLASPERLFEVHAIAARS